MASNPQGKDAPVKRGMAEWYDPGLLAGTGVRSIVSALFGEFADKREAIAAANAIQPTPVDGEFDYSAQSNADGDFWFDYLADSGDGWNPTFAMARLVAEDTLLGDKPRGRLLILGGDQVYPTASRGEYRDRFIGPFDHAYDGDGTPRWTRDKRPHLYAIPGNHDWYDGLNSFFGLFCRRRVVRKDHDLGISREGKVIGGRRTQQTRSYFAIALPNDWWVWGTDCQLEGYIDQPQIDYFQHAAAYWMKPGSKLILCVADPAWAYVDPKDPDKKFESFSYLERLAGMARVPLTEEQERQGARVEDQPFMGHKLKLVLTGDSHHYCRWVEDKRNYIVCGGGGAFLHPTHHLRPSCFDYRFPRPGEEARPGKYPREFKIAKTEDGREALFPDRNTSAGLAKGNFLFAWKNKKFVVLLMCVYGFFNWILDFNAKLSLGETLARALRDGSWLDAFIRYWDVLVPTSPWSALLVLISLFAYIGFAESPRSTGLKIFMGAKHALTQAFFVTLTTIVVMRGTTDLIADPRLDSIVSVALATIAAAIVSATVFGSYLWFWIRWFRRHPNEGFSSMAIENFKSFLRLKIDKAGGLTVFPIGLRDVPKNDDTGELKEHLIEPAIRIEP
jgi:hypothetical protein